MSNLLNKLTINSVVSLFCLAIVLVALVTPEMAFANDYDIGSAEGPWAKIVEFLQDIVDLLGGPIAKFVLFVSLVVFVILWIWNPAGAALGGLFRLIIGIVVVINAGLFLVSLGA